MPNKLRKGTLVLDKVTNTVQCITKATCRNIDGTWVWFVLLKSAPRSPDYPDGWRYSGEISVSQAAIRAAENVTKPH